MDKNLKFGQYPAMAHLFSAIVGTVLLLAGLLKVNFSLPFIRHVSQLRLIPARLSGLAALLFIELECGLGIALILFVYPADIIPAVIVLLFVLTAISSWGVLSDRVADCGCYGSHFQPSVTTHMLLNGLLIVILLLAWAKVPGDSLQVEPARLWGVIAVILLTHLLAKRSIKGPLLDYSGIRSGMAWNNDWFDLKQIGPNDSNLLLVFFSYRCHVCKNWIQHLNPHAGDVSELRIIGLTPRNDKPEEDQEPAFPVYPMTSPVFSRLKGFIPLAVLVEDGIIKEKRIGKFPFEYFNSC